jgi:hypothetical protein
MKELRFSIQCGASNRKALVARRCSQCTADNDELELNDLPQQNQITQHHRPSNRSSSSSVNLQTSKHRPTLERTSDTDKFGTLLMLAAERTNYLDTRRKNIYDERKHRHLSVSPQRKDIPLVLVEQQASNHEPNRRSHHQVRFTSNTGTLKIQKVMNKIFSFFFRFICSKRFTNSSL